MQQMLRIDSIWFRSPYHVAGLESQRARTRRSSRQQRHTSCAAEGQTAAKATSVNAPDTQSDIQPERQPIDVSRRQMIHSAITSSIAHGAATVLPGILPPPSAALPITTRLPIIGQAPPGTHNHGVAAVRDPALYRYVC